MQALIQQMILCRKTLISTKKMSEPLSLGKLGKSGTLHISDYIFVHHLVTFMYAGYITINKFFQ